MAISLRQKLKNFFKAEESSEHAVELLQYFILPFARGRRAENVDDMLAAFFAVDDRKFVYVRVKKGFKLPGKLFVAGNRPIYGLGPREVKRGQVMLMALDRVDNLTRVEVVFDDVPYNYLLEKFELETIKDWVDVIGEG